MTMNIHAAGDKVLATANRATNVVMHKYTTALAEVRASRVKAELVKAPGNTFDGVATYQMTASKGWSTVSWDAQIRFSDGVPVINAEKALEEFNTAYLKVALQTFEAGAPSLEEMGMSVSKVIAKRHGDTVMYTAEQLPGFAFAAKTENLKTGEGRSTVLASLKQHMTVHAASVMSKELKLEGEKLPVAVAGVVTQTIQAKANAAAYFEVSDEATAALLKAQHQMGFDKPTLVATQAPKAGAGEGMTVVAYDRNLHQAVLNTLGVWASKNKFTKLSLASAERKDGKVVANLSFYGPFGPETRELVLAYTNDKLDPEKVVLSATQEKIEADKLAALKIASEADAVAELERAKAADLQNRQAHAMVQANLGHEIAGAASYGNTALRVRPAMERIPILRALLPEGTKAGDKMEIDGYVYKLVDTDYNSLNVDASLNVYVMACLTDELPGSGKTVDMGLLAKLANALVL